MRTDILFTLTGPDRVGSGEDLTGVVLGLQGNVETSRMMRLGGEFALLMLVSMPAERTAELGSAVSALVAEGYKVTATPTRQPEDAHAAWLPYKVTVVGADHDGIVHEIAQRLSQRGISIESMDTAIVEAPVSGAPLFSMSAVVLVPPGLAEDDWVGELADAGDQANVDVEVTAGA